MARFTAANMKGWTEKQKRNLELIVRQSIQDVSEAAQRPKAQGGRLPVDTGFLRNSYTAEGLSGPDAYIAAVGSFSIGGVFEAGWTATYAQRMEYGFSGQDALGRTYNVPGNFFMGSALQQWQSIVEENARKVT